MLNTQTAANTFIICGFKENIPITPMKLQKLVYILYKNYLIRTNHRLFEERFLQWRYGPVLQSLYYEFKCFGAAPITKFARDANGSVETINLSICSPAAQSFNEVWNKYKMYSATELSAFTHRTNSAWSNAKGGVLQDEDIKNEREFIS